MKKFFILCLMAFVMCSCNLEQKRIAEERARFVADSLAKRELFVADSIAKVREREKFVADSLAKVEHIKEIKSSIKIEDYFLCFPNYAGGCNMNIHYRNISKKTIKYITFECEFYNAVDDYAWCEIYNSYKRRIKDVGPINYWEYDSNIWSDVIYNHNARKMEIVGINIDYMDGTKLEISRDEMQYVKGYKGRRYRYITFNGEVVYE